MKQKMTFWVALTALSMLLFPVAGFGQAVRVSGTVTDDQGAPVIGAMVLEQGSGSNATITDAQGRYSISVAPAANLEFSFMGYAGQIVPVGGRTTVDVQLVADARTIDEVVVIGYGQLRREAVTGSVASVRGDVVREVPASNITQALAGRVAGVEMMQTSSKPGAAMQIRIRGTRSLTASNDPLVVLDGIPFAGSLGDIDPNSIKNIDILKDASATAIYGSRGANGVILVTTKSGARGNTPTTVSYSGYYGIKDAIELPMMNGAQFNELKEYLKTAPAGVTGLYTGLGVDETATTDTDWQGMLYRQGYLTSHDINVAGSSQTSAFSIGANYTKDQSVVPTSNFTRYALRANVDTEIARWFRVGLVTNTNYSYTVGQQIGPPVGNSPLLDLYNADGSLKSLVSSVSDANTWVYTRKTVEDNAERWRNDTRALGTYNTVYAEVKAPWIEGLKYRINVGLNYTQSHNGSFTGQGVNSTNPTSVSIGALDNRNTVNWAIENLLTYDRTFNDKHNINVVGLYSREQTTYNRSNISGRNIPNEKFLYWNIGRAEESVTINPSDQDYWQSGLVSYMARAMYSYDNRYMISATVRSDGSSRLAAGHKWHTYPAVSAGWNIANEAFMEDVSWVDALKLRVGYGQTSNQSIDPYSTLGLLNTRTYNFGSEYATGYYVSELANTALGWEYSKTWNYGLDFTLFRSRLTGTIEYYSQKTSDVLQNVNLPITGGVDSYMANIGKTENKGIEITLNGVIIDNLNGWTWEAGLNFYANRNKLTALHSSNDGRNEGNMWFVGYPINSMYDYEAIGLWQEGDAHMSILEPSATPGSIRVKYSGEYNADGTPTRAIGNDDRQIMPMDPDFQGGFNTRVSWKGFDLSVVGAFQRGGMLISTLYQGSGYLNQLNGRRGQVVVDYWRPDNTGAHWPNPYGLRSGDNLKYLNSMGYFDATYLKLRTITLGWSLPAKWLDSAGISSLRLYATVQNPLVLFSEYHKLSGLDPEPNARANESAYSAVASSNNLSRFLVVGTNHPSTRNYLFGVNLTF